MLISYAKNITSKYMCFPFQLLLILADFKWCRFLFGTIPCLRLFSVSLQSTKKDDHCQDPQRGDKQYI